MTKNITIDGINYICELTQVAPVEVRVLTKIKIALQFGLVVFIILLVLLGLIIWFNKMRNDDDDDDESENYY